MKTTYIRRDIEIRVRKYAGMFPVVAVTGARQTGKTTMLKKAFGAYSYYNFDDSGIRAAAERDPGLFISRMPEKCMIDEIQYVPQLLSHIKMKADEDPDIKGRFILTGSQQFLMMKGLTETLAGRVGILDVFPLSMGETAPYKKIKDPRKIFVYSCLRGTYPRPVVDESLDMKDWYVNYLSTYIERDAKTLYNIGSIRDFDAFVRILASRAGQTLNMSALSADIGVAVNTIKSWVSIMQASGIIHLLYPYHANIRSQLTKSPKVYFTDVGFVCHINRIYDENAVFDGGMSGMLYENFCIMETVKKLRNAGKTEQVYYFRNSKGLEVDLLVESGRKLLPVEIKASSKPDISAAENIEKLRKLLPGKILPGYVLNLGNAEIQLTAGVGTKGIFDFIESI
jgi:predicted AAA+ superfamily ATPase